MIRIGLFFVGIALMFFGHPWIGAILSLVMFLTFFIGTGADGINPVEIAQHAKYNRDLKNMGVVDDSHIVGETIGWRKDPIHKEDGQTEVEPLDDGTPVYQRTIRRGRQKN